MFECPCGHPIFEHHSSKGRCTRCKCKKYKFICYVCENKEQAITTWCSTCGNGYMEFKKNS
jgi:hypothetical protein